MSKQIDERVVEMRFDNKQFESATKESMSTLDKFKQKLQFKDATKGFGDLEKAAKKVDLNPLSKAAETVSMKFSAMQVAGVTAIANLTNSAVNASKNIVKALTITPVTTGFQEYQTQIGAIQTILANTKKEGTNVERVNAALDELNTYADQTIYNFTEMTRNIGTFTAAGVKLDDSVSAIKGIANLAAVSGSTSQQASTAMYQLSQALAAGKVSLMDWNSVVNAGMGGQVFQDALIRTSENLKTGAKQAIATYGTFRESLTKSGWLTKEVLTETLGQLAGAYSEADLLAKGYSAEQAKEIVKLAETAKSAATDVKTFTQLWDTLKEAVQSGWGQTWRMIVGDFDEAKERMTKLSKLFGDIIEKSSNRRNSMLNGALNSNWSKLTKRLSDAGIKTEDFQNKIKELAKTHNVNLDEMVKQEGSFEKALKKAFSSGTLDKSILIDTIKSFVGGITDSANAAKAASNQMEKYGEIANRVIRGDFGDGAERIKKLTDAGYEYAAVQNIVNERLGSSVRHVSSLTDEQLKYADSLSDLTDEQLKNKGYTDEQIVALRDLKKEADDAGSSIYKLINGFEKPSGVELAWSSVFNILDSITESCKAIKKAWTEIFHPGMTEDQIIAERSARLYKLLESIHAFTESLKVNDDTAQKITKTFKGLFAILDLVRVLVGGTFGIAFTIFKEILSAFNLDVLDVTASVGDAVVKFRDWVKSILDFKKIFAPVVKLVKGFINIIRDWFDEFKKTDEVQNLTKKFNEFRDSIKMDDSSADNFKKITEGLSALLSKMSLVLNASLLSSLKVLGAVLNLFGTNLANVAANLIDYLAKSKKWINENILIANTIDEVATIIKTLIDGIKNCVRAFMSLEPVQKFITNFKNAFNDLFDVMSKAFSGFGVENFAGGLAKAFKSLQEWIETLNNSDNIGRDIVAGLLNGLKAGMGAVISFVIGLGKNILEAIKTVLGIHSPSTEFFDIGKNIIAGLINGIKAGVSSLLSFIGNIGQKCVDVISKIDFGKVFTLAISAGIIYSGKKIYDLAEKFAAPLEGLGKMFGGIGHMFNSVGKILDNFAGMIKVKKYEAIAKMFLNFGIAIGIMSASIYILSNIEPAKLWNAVGAVAALGAVMVALSYAMSQISGASASISKDGIKISGIKTALISLGVTLLLMAAAVKLVGSLNSEQAKQGFLGLAGLVVAIGVVLLAFGTLVKGKQAQNIDKLGTMLAKLSIALLLLAVTVKIIAGISEDDIQKGVDCITAFGAIIAGLILATSLAGKKVNKVGGTLLKISAAMLLMVTVIKLLSGMSVSEITKGIVCITAFSGIMVGLVAITKLAGKDLTKVGSTILAMSAAITLMALTMNIVASMSVGEIIKGVACISAFGLIITGLIATTRLAGKGELKRVASTILAMSISIGILAAISVLLGLVDIATLKKGITAVSILGLMMAGMIAATKGAENIKGNIVAMTVAIGIMTTAIAVLSFIDPSRLAGATVAMGILMSIFAVMVKVSGMAQAAIGPIIAMSAVVGLLAGIIWGLSKLPVDSALGSTEALSVLLLSMSVSMAILSKVGISIKGALAGAVGLLAMAVPLVAFVGILAAMQKINNAMSNAIVLAGFVTVMTGLLAVLTVIGVVYAATGGLAATGILGLLAMAVPLLAFVGILALMQGIQNAESNANVLISLMTAMTSLLTQVSILGPLALLGVTSITAMTAVITVLAGLVVAVGALNEKFPQLETFLDSGIELLTKLASGLGQIIGSFVGGIAQGLTSKLPEVATNLSMFMANLMPFITGIRLLDESVLTNAQTLASLIITFTKAGLLESVTSWLGAGDSLNEFALQLVPFGMSMVAFSNTVKGIDESAVTAAANAGKMMAEMAKTIPREGGWWDAIAGEKDMASFGLKLVAFGSAIKSFSAILTTGDPINEDAVKSAANAGKQMTDLANSMPKSGGIWQRIIGEQDIGIFGAKLVAYTASIKVFASSIKGLKIDESAVSSAINAGKKMSEFADIIPKSGGWWGAIAGEKDIGEFGAKVAKFGKAIKEFSESVSGKISGVDSTVSSIKKLVSMFKNISNINGNAIDSFKSSLNSLGKISVDGFIKSFDGAAGRAKIAINVFLNATSSAISKQKESLNKLFDGVGKYLVDGFAKGITDNTFKAEAKAKAMANKAYEAARKALDEHSPSKKFIKVGAFVVAGFARGISKNVGDVNKASVKMANGVLEATQNELGIHSPSVVFDKEVGRYIVQGIAEGIKKDMSAEEAAEKKAQNIVNAFQNALDFIDLSISNRDKEFDLWRLTDGKMVSDAAITEKEIKKLNDNLWDQNQNVKLLTDEYELLKQTFGANNKNTLKAYGEMLDAQTTAAETASSMITLRESLATSEENIIDQTISIKQKQNELWHLMDENNPRSNKMITDAFDRDYYKYVIDERRKLASSAQKAYDDILAAGYDKNHAKSRDAFEKFIDARIDEEQAEKDLFEYDQSVYERDIQELEDQKSRNDKKVDLWELVYGEDASNRQRYLFYKKQYEQILDIVHKETQKAIKRYWDFVKAYAEENKVTEEMARSSDRAKQLWDKVADSQIAEEEAKKKVRDNRKDYLEQEEEDLKTQLETASDMAELRYQIWEKTNGRKATDTEKETMKLAMLTEQLSKQSKLVNIAKNAWKNANSEDKQKLEKEYLSAQLELANLQSDVLDIQEENIKRQERAIERQRNAQDEYNDYIKKYEKYYLEHGMTRDELEKDAKLVSGYDPTQLTEKAISKTNKAIDNVKTNVANLTKAVGEGIQNGVSEITDSTTSILKTCAEAINANKMTWNQAGLTLVDAFIEGIRSKTEIAANAAAELAARTLEAIKKAFANDGNYTPTIRPVLDMSNINAGTSKLSSMLSGKTSLGLASSIAKRTNTSQSFVGPTQPQSSSTYTFTQNNYSPKSLSSVEIYRQTKNMLTSIRKKG